jgi:glutamine amidotransferase-like uncharacterized protein
VGVLHDTLPRRAPYHPDPEVIEMRKIALILAVFAQTLPLAGCLDGGGPSVARADGAPFGGGLVPGGPPPGGDTREYHTDALVFTGPGTWSAEVTNLVAILKENGATYETASAAKLESMSVDDLAKYGVLIFPGGSGGTQAGSVSDDTHARLREAVQSRGVNYVGFCAGAWIAVAPKPAPGKDVSYGFGVAEGPVLDFYYLTDQGVDVAMTMHSFADGTKRDIVWYGGPVTPEWPSGVVARYPNGQPAISQTFSGKGLVVIAATHPAAPQSIRDAYGVTDKDGLDFDVAWNLIAAALHQRPLPAY